jgi:polysaccharide biosynthesis protein VpsQ
VRLKWLAIAFTIFIVAVIALADLGRLRFLFRIMGRYENLDVLLHFILIGTLTFLVTASLIQTFPTKNLRMIVFVSIFFFLIFFTIEELSQIPIRGRSFSVKDLVANYLGILVFGFLAWWKYGRAKTITPSK